VGVGSSNISESRDGPCVGTGEAREKSKGVADTIKGHKGKKKRGAGFFGPTRISYKKKKEVKEVFTILGRVPKQTPTAMVKAKAGGGG